MLKTIKKTLGNKNEDAPRSGVFRGNKDDQNKHREHEVHRDENVDQSMQASPTYAKAGQPLTPRVIFAVEGFVAYKWKNQQGEADLHPPFTPLDEVTAAPDRYQRKRIKIQGLIRHTMLLCGTGAPQERAPTRIHGEGANGASQSSQMDFFLFFTHLDAVCTNDRFPIVAFRFVDFVLNARLGFSFCLTARRDSGFNNFVLPFDAHGSDAARTDGDTIRGRFFENMSQRWWKENRRTEAWLEPWRWEKPRVPETDPQRTLSKKSSQRQKNPWELKKSSPSGPLLACQTLYLKK